MAKQNVVKQYALPIFLLLTAFLCTGTSWKAGENVREGNSLFRQGKYDGALEKYNLAQTAEPDAPEIKFNMADVFYKQGKYNEAVESYMKAMERGTHLKAKTHYNIGNALFRQGRFEEAIDAYKRALELDPNDLDAKYNIEFTRLKMKQMQAQAKETAKAAEKDRKSGKGQSQQAKEAKAGKNNGKPSGQDMAKMAQDKNKSEAAKQGEKTGEGKLSREEAERVLSAIEDEEKNLPEKVKINRDQMKEKEVEKDW